MKKIQILIYSGEFLSVIFCILIPLTFSLELRVSFILLTF